MNMTSHDHDRSLIKAKDYALLAFTLIAGLWGGILTFTRYVNLPKDVDGLKTCQTAQAQEIVNLHSTDAQLAAHLDQINLKIDYSNKGIDELRDWMKARSEQLKKTEGNEKPSHCFSHRSFRYLCVLVCLDQGKRFQDCQDYRSLSSYS